MIKKKCNVYEEGQVLLIIVLIITVVLTVSLSLFTRSIVNVKLTTEEDQSQRALSAAEAGIEQTIIANAGITNGTLSMGKFSTSKRQLSGTQFLLNNGKTIFQDEGADIWLTQYSTDSAKLYQSPWSGTLTISWDTSTDPCTAAAVEIIVISGTRSNPSSTRYAFDPCVSRRSNNNFSTPSSGTRVVAGKSFPTFVGIPITSGLLARVVPLYANSYFAVEGSPALPAQGSVIESTGSVGDVKRKISVLQENPFLPTELFHYTLFLTR